MRGILYHISRLATAAMLIAAYLPAKAQRCDDCYPRVAIKTNLVSDAMLTPDLGIELSIARRFSLSVTGMMAWWSNTSRNRFWRIYGGNAEMRCWIGKKASERALSGHHIGIFGSMHSFDFEFGYRGWQSPDLSYSAGVSYGYSFPVASRLNIDVGARIGYAGGEVIRYKPQCGAYVCTSRSRFHYFGPTGVEVSLVWFPGKNQHNRPAY